MSTESTVFVVDDDRSVRDSLAYLLKADGWRVETFVSAAQFLEDYCPDRLGCLILDLRLPGMNGLELQKKLADQQMDIPIIIITGHADVHIAVEAMKNGAVEFLEKPFSDQVLCDRVRDAVHKDAQQRRRRAQRAVIAARLATLSRREQQVFEYIARGWRNKQVAAELAISNRTVELHRSRVMRKMQAQNVTELVRMALAVGAVNAQA